MAKRKTARKSKVIRRPHITSSHGPTYDTLMIVTILLLLFVYPIGIIFMWAWMKTWPTWLKAVISAPFIIAITFLIIVSFIVGSIIHRGLNKAIVEEHRIERMQQIPTNMPISVTPTPQVTY